MNTPKRSVAKLRIRCQRCQCAFAPCDGEWRDGADNQIFICHSCEQPSRDRGRRMLVNPAEPMPAFR